jgi:hypothetical protein
MALTFGGVTGEASTRDLIIPKLDLVQNVGDLSVEFKPGDYVLNRETLLAHAGDALKLHVVHLDKYYEENLKFAKDGPRPRTWRNEVQLHKDGMTLSYGADGAPPTAREVGVLTVAVQRPDAAPEVAFGLVANNTRYALALWTVRKSAYPRVYKRAFSASQLELKKPGLPSGIWTLSSERINVNGNWIFVPVFSLTGCATAAEVEALKQAIM